MTSQRPNELLARRVVEEGAQRIGGGGFRSPFGGLNETFRCTFDLIPGCGRRGSGLLL